MCLGSGFPLSTCVSVTRLYCFAAASVVTYLNFLRLSTFSGGAVASRRCISARGTDTSLASASENPCGVEAGFSAMPLLYHLQFFLEIGHTAAVLMTAPHSESNRVPSDHDKGKRASLMPLLMLVSPPLTS